MRIYISHSRRFNFQGELYFPLRQTREFLPHELILPHEGSDGLYPVVKELEDRKIGLVIAELSYPSTNQGIELGLAKAYGVPVGGMFRDGSTPPSAISVVTENVQCYRNARTLVETVGRLIS